MTRDEIKAETKREILNKIPAYRALPLKGIAQQITDRLNVLDICYPVYETARTATTISAWKRFDELICQLAEEAKLKAELVPQLN